MTNVKVDGLHAFSASSKKNARTHILRKLGVKRLPYGFGKVLDKTFRRGW